MELTNLTEFLMNFCTYILVVHLINYRIIDFIIIQSFIMLYLINYSLGNLIIKNKNKTNQKKRIDSHIHH